MLETHLWHDGEVGEAAAGAYGRRLGQACHASLHERTCLALFLMQKGGSIALQIRHIILAHLELAY